MSPKPYKVFLLILKLITRKASLFFWLAVRFVSALLPLYSIYLFSNVIQLLEKKSPITTVIYACIFIFLVRILDNYLRLRSITRLEDAISNIGFDIHNFFLSNLQSETKVERHATVQAIRNFAEASMNTLNFIKQPGIDSIVSIVFIPPIIFILDPRVFVILIAYILVYLITDHYTTQRYAHLKDILNQKTENYYAALQDENDFDLEQSTWSRNFRRLTEWSFTEWFALQNIAVFFYSATLLYLIFSYIKGDHDLSSLVLIIGYITQTQVFLNSFSQIHDSITDMLVGLQHLARNNSVSVIDLDDLI